jgi:predicted 3-demethylubiquinone-9 3-methyltransferase (glyoxalase superfamily)
MVATNATQAGAISTAGNERTEPRPQKITTFLWFDNNAEEAANFYVSIFQNSKIVSSARYTDAGPGPKGSVMTIAFQLDGRDFTALNGGPQFKFTEAISLVVHCKTQEEVDHFWEKLSEGGEKVQCGWLKDKFGLSWQVVPDALLELLQDGDSQKLQRVMKAMMQMKKLDIEGLKQAAEGK